MSNNSNDGFFNAKYIIAAYICDAYPSYACWGKDENCRSRQREPLLMQNQGNGK